MLGFDPFCEFLFFYGGPMFVGLIIIDGGSVERTNYLGLELQSSRVIERQVSESLKLALFCLAKFLYES